MNSATPSRTGPGGHWGLLYLAGIPFRTGFTRERMDGLRDRRLRWLVRNAYRWNPFYRELLDNNGVSAASIGGFADLERLPLISRKDLRDAGERAWAQDLPEHKRIIASTSGSSDTPLMLAYRFSDRLRKHVASLHCMSMYGWRPWHRGMALGSEALPHNHRLAALGISRWTWIDPSRPVQEWLDEYLRLRPQALHSYPSALREFCFQVRESGPLTWVPKVLSVGGELYPEELTPLVTETFGRPPLVMYGAVEAGRIAFECRAHDGLHVRPDTVHVEILHDGQPVAPGEYGSVYITSLVNTVMPIIRYELGDLAAWKPGACSCGLWWPRLTIRQGRKGDVIVLPGGRRVPVTSLATIAGKSRGIRQFQFVRRSENTLVLRYEAAADPTDSVSEVHEKLRRALPGIDLLLERSGPLPRTRSGKVVRYIDASRNTEEESKDL